MLDKRGWATARDHYGHTPLHKAVMANQEDVLKHIVQTYPDLVEERDNVNKFFWDLITMLFTSQHTVFRREELHFIMPPLCKEQLEE